MIRIVKSAKRAFFTIYSASHYVVVTVSIAGFLFPFFTHFLAIFPQNKCKLYFSILSYLLISLTRQLPTVANPFAS